MVPLLNGRFVTPPSHGTLLVCRSTPLCPPTAILWPQTKWRVQQVVWGIPWHPGGFSLFFGVVAVCRCPCPYNRKVDPPLLSLFSCSRTHLFLALVPPVFSPDSQVTALYYFLLIGLNSAASMPKPGVCATQEVLSLSLT